jgi:hypothetical protein
MLSVLICITDLVLLKGSHILRHILADDGCTYS